MESGVPLAVNSVSVALSNQADRFLVGSMLGLPTLGVYSVISTAVIIPANMVSRILGGINTSLLYKAMNSGRAKARPIVLVRNPVSHLPPLPPFA